MFAVIFYFQVIWLHAGEKKKNWRHCDNFPFIPYISASLVIDIQWNVKLLPFISLESNEYLMFQPIYVKAL